MAKLEDSRYRELLKALQSQDPEHLDFLLKPRDPYAIRDELENSLGRHVAENYDLPKTRLNELFEKKIEMPKIISDPSQLQGNEALYRYLEGGKNPEIIVNPKRGHFEQLGDMLHELGHHKDVVSGYDPEDIAKSIHNPSKLAGLDAAEKYFEGHHEKGLFGLEALKNLLKSGKIKSVAALLGPAAIGMGALGATQDAMAGDMTGAALKGASVIDPTGITSAASTIKERLEMSPEDAKVASAQDRLSALPVGLDIEQSAIDQADDHVETLNSQANHLKAMANHAKAQNSLVKEMNKSNKEEAKQKRDYFKNIANMVKGRKD